MGRRPAYKLMGRMPLPGRVSAIRRKGCPLRRARGITRRFHRLSPGRGQVAYALRTRPPLSTPRRGPPVRLACIRPAASVHPEPGSNSSLYIVVLILFFCCSWRIHLLSSLFGILGSLPFRLLFIGSLLSKNFATSISVDCGCKSTHFFLTRNTFLQIFFKLFF